MTEELLVHAGINHQLAVYSAFPHLCIDDYSLRNSGNRGIESIHGTFRGGTASLPITSANLSFQEFLSKMNSMMQINTAKHELQKVQGCPIVATKKKRVTQAPSSCSDVHNDTSGYTKPLPYNKFLAELDEACDKGDADAKQVIEELAPEMARFLKQKKEWKSPLKQRIRIQIQIQM